MATIGNDWQRLATEQAAEEAEEEPTDQNNNSNTNTVTMSVSPFDADMQDVLTRVFNLDITTNPLPDLAEGLAHSRYFTWTALLCLRPTDVATLSKKTGNRRGPLMPYQERKLHSFVEFINSKKASNVADPFSTSTYTPENLQEYIVAHIISHILSPPLAPSNSNAKSPDEQKLQDWIRGKCFKDDFEVLKEDKYHDTWEIPFEAEIIVQGLQNRITFTAE